MLCNYDTIGSLPNLVFFEPTEAFFKYLSDTVPHRQVIDVGAGAGFLSRELSKRGFKVLAIDLIERDEPLHPVFQVDASEFPFPKNAVPIMARPCHSDWVEETVWNALKTAPYMLYVGLEKNLVEDLGNLGPGYKWEKVLEGAGAEDEMVIKISRNYPQGIIHQT
jgi:hypothetical protein